MNNIYKLQTLNFTNYLELVDFIDNHDYLLEFWSPIALTEWSFYGFQIKFRVLKNEDAILMYLKNENWKLTTSFFNDNINLDEIWLEVKKDLKELNKNDEIEFEQISESMIQNWKIDHSKLRKLPYVSNYIYYTEKLKSFSGKKLQKKRNHLNYFLINNTNVEIKDIRDVSKEEILNYCKEHMLYYTNQINKSEFDSYEQLINNELDKTSKYIGSVVYINSKIEGITLCYLRKNICEIVIEKASKEIRGLYQYLIKENLTFHNVNQEYLDRQDDSRLDYLAKSKLSYYPVYTVKRYSTKK